MEQLESLWTVGLGELPEAGRFGSVGKFVELDGALHGHVTLQVREADFNQLFGVQRSVPVSLKIIKRKDLESANPEAS